MSIPPKPIVLAILDGWGYREPASDNAISMAHTPHWDQWWKNYPHTLLQGSGISVGLPKAQMGNSEVGHLTLGAGRVIDQDFTAINHAIDSGEFFKHVALLHQLRLVEAQGGKIHLLGLFSPGGVHSHERHFYALLKLLNQFKLNAVYLHLFLDGRDTPPKSAISSIVELEKWCEAYPNIQIASLIGRYYAMDRDQNWDRIQKAYALIMQGSACYHAKSALEGLEAAYGRGETDEFIQPTLINAARLPVNSLSENDRAIFVNFRADRARQLTQALIDPDFTHFPRNALLVNSLITLTQYSEDLKTTVLFPRQPIKNTLGEVIANHQLKQLRLAETEKYAHVTYFFNGGSEKLFTGETRRLIPSPAVSTYNLKPEMSAFQLTEVLLDEIYTGKQDVMICNFANPDMVGHTGDFKATVRAIETVDYCLGKVVEALQKIGGEIIITADHGNAESMVNIITHQAHTAHTCAQVPFLYIGRPAVIIESVKNPTLTAIAPTLLTLLGLTKPVEMTGENLISFLE